MKVLLNWFRNFSNIIAATIIGVLIAFYLIYEAPVWIGNYCENHTGGICQIQTNDDDN
jgi:hypothetical protein